MNRSLVLKIWAGCGLAYGVQLFAFPDFVGQRFFGKAVNDIQRYYSRLSGIFLLGFTATAYGIAEYGNQEIQNLAGKIGTVYMAAIGLNSFFHQGTLLDGAVTEGLVVAGSFTAFMVYHFFGKQ